MVPLLQALNGYQLEQDDDEVADTAEGEEEGGEERAEEEDEGEEDKKQRNCVSESDSTTLQL